MSPHAQFRALLVCGTLGCLPRSCDGLASTGLPHSLLRRRRCTAFGSLSFTPGLLVRSAVSMVGSSTGSGDGSASGGVTADLGGGAGIDDGNTAIGRADNDLEPSLPFATAFQLPLALPHGRKALCVAIHLPLYPCKPDDDYCPSLPLDELHEEEVVALDTMHPVRQVAPNTLWMRIRPSSAPQQML